MKVTVQDLVTALDLTVLAGRNGLSRPVSSGYCGDLLSDVLASARQGAAWFTVQTHVTIVAVALRKKLACIIVTNGYRPDTDTLVCAENEVIPVLTSPETGFILSGRLYRVPGLFC